MTARSGLLLILVVGAALTAVALLLLQDDDLEPGDDVIERGRGPTDDDTTPLDPDGAHLAPAPGARSPEERAAERARAEAAANAVPRAEGIYGRVTDARDHPIADAKLRVGLSTLGIRTWGVPEPPALATATTDADGYYVVGPAPTEGILRLRAEAEGYAPTVRVVRRRGCRVDLVLDLGGALEVVVKDTNGDAVKDAFVLHQAGEVVSDARTDEEGLAAFPGLPTGTGALTVTGEGHASIRQEGVAVAPGETERLTVVLGEPIVVEGRVLDAVSERPIAAAKIVARNGRMPWIDAAPPVVSDPEGRFEFATVTGVGHSLEVDASAKGYAATRTWVTVTDSGSGRMTTTIRLSAGSFVVRGEVLDHRGRAVQGARVTYMRDRSQQKGPETQTDRDGWFTLPAPPWAGRPGASAQVVAVSEIMGLGSAFARIPKEGEQAKPLRIRLSGIGTVRGRVTDDGSTPVAGALVTLAVDWNATMRQAQAMPGGAGAPPWLLAQALQDPRHTRLDAVTNEDGRYEIDVVPAASYQLSASFGRDTVTSEDTVVVDSGGTVERSLVMGEGATIEGWVQDGEGAPVPGAYVSAYPVRRAGVRPGMASAVSARSQSDGAFILRGTAADSYTLRAWAAGYESQSQQKIQPGTKGVLLELRPLGWVSGVVLHEGRPFQGTFTVSARRHQEGRRAQKSRIRGGGQTQTFNTDDGTFVLRSLRAGEYALTAQTSGGHVQVEPQMVEIRDGKETQASLVLALGATIEGVVVDDETTTPLSGARINVRPVLGEGEASSGGSSTTDDEGRFSVRALNPGQYTVHVSPRGDVSFFEVVEVQQGATLQVRLRKRPPGSIRISVRDRDGRPLEGATPRVRTASGTEIWPNWSLLRKEGMEFSRDTMRNVTQTDATGTNVRQHVPPGNFEVSATKDGYEVVEPQSVEVASRRTAEVEVVLRPRE